MKTCIINLIATVILFAISIPCFFFKLQEISFGILLGGMIGSLTYAILHLIQKGKIFSTVIFLIVKTILVSALLLGFGFLYFQAEFKVFNPIAITLTYLVSTLVLVLLSRKEANNG